MSSQRLATFLPQETAMCASTAVLLSLRTDSYPSDRPCSVLTLAHYLDMHSDIASCSDPWDPVPDLYNFCLPLLQPKMVHPVSSVGLCTAAVSPSKAAANTNALAWMGLWAAYPCAAWTCACPALTAPSREGSNCLGNAVRSGCVTSPRIAQQLALP